MCVIQNFDFMNCIEIWYRDTAGVYMNFLTWLASGTTEETIGRDLKMDAPKFVNSWKQSFENEMGFCLFLALIFNSLQI